MIGTGVIIFIICVVIYQIIDTWRKGDNEYYRKQNRGNVLVLLVCVYILLDRLIAW